MIGFRTRKGVVLLYEPSLLDAWIDRKIEKTEEGTFTDMESGKILTKQEGKQYRTYLKRHESRNEEARQADKLFHTVDKYLPLQADETRAFIARFPCCQRRERFVTGFDVKGDQPQQQKSHPRGGTARDQLQVLGATLHRHRQGKQPSARENSEQGEQSAP